MQSNITPVSVFPASATILFVRSGGLGPPPGFYYQLQASDGTVLKDGNVSMTQDQWSAWGSGGDDSAYILSSVAANLGLTLAP